MTSADQDMSRTPPAFDRPQLEMPSDFFFNGASVQDATNGVGGFADALLARYGENGLQNVKGHEIFVNPPPVADRAPSNPAPALTVLALPRMPTALPTRTSVASTPSAAGPPVQPTAFEPTSPEGLHALLDDSACLVVDLRPHAQYANARLPHAMSLSVPSTLLKRPAFPLSKLADMLPASARSRLSQWPAATRVLVYDGDGAPPSQSSNIGGLLNKFVAEGCPPSKLTWLKGGFQNIWRHHRELVDADPSSDDDDEASGNEGDEPALGTLQSRQLPLAAFTSSSTTASKQTSSTPRLEASRSASHVAFNPFFDAIRQNLELSQGVTERIPLRFPQSVMDRVEDLPFRWLRELVRHARAEGVVSGPKDQMDEGSETLAMQFYRIELAEQRRLTGIMQHHSTQDSGVRVADADNAVAFPYSITAGVEKGGKNRYRNIWPFEHARVRLQQTRSSDDDYINASYVQPLGTKKRYIATQGPLPATFGDFWALVWEQNVHVVVMLTREIEGAMVKCGKYWAEGTYGALRLRQLSSSGGTPDTSSDVRKPDAGAAGFFMPSVPAATAHASPSMICRTFELSHTGFPKARPRKITQFHYVDWPDMNVPESPRGLLDLIREVNHARTQAEVTTAAERARAASSWDWKGVNQDQACTITGVARHALGHQPVLLHCSAGVGRTGGFIAVDAILDGIRHELAADDVQYAEIVVDSSDCEERELQAMAVDTSSSMDVDMPSTSTTPIPVIMTGQIGQHHEARAAVQRSSPAGSLRKPRRPSREGIWAKNDPRQMPLRKWLVATNEATTRDAQLAPAVSPVPTLTGAPLNASPGPMKSANALPPSTTPSPSLASLNVSFSPGPVFPQEDPLHKTLPPLSAARLHSDSQRVRAASAPSVASGILARRLAAQNTSGLGGPHESTSSLSTPSDAGPSLFSAIGGSATSVTSPSPTSSILLVPTVSACPPSSEGPTETFDYTTPRKLHTDAAPCPLSTLSEPIRAVIEDAREQRMSLCQSLRQYVFVHQAVVEGALALVDELHAAPTRARTTSGASTASGSTAESVATASVLRPSMSPSRAKRRRSTMDADGLREAGATLSKRPSIKRERIAGDSCA